MLKRTPLFEVHRKLGARLVEFAGWEMPVHYTSIMDEHETVRTAAGLFDICHMGDMRVSGPSALAFLNHVLTNDASRLEVGQGQYTLLCNARGGVIDDLYLYRLAKEDFLLIVNASRIEADWDWLQQQFQRFASDKQTKLSNESDRFGALAIQGPRVIEFIDQCISNPSTGGTKVEKPSQLKKNQIAEVQVNRESAWIARTGYTGEDGFEIVAPAQSMESLWNRLVELGQGHGLKPAGLGARDTLRTEVCYPLYGHELDENTTPVEAGLSFFVGWDKNDFVGRSKLLDQKTNGVTKKCVAFKMTDKSAPPRPHYPIWRSDANEKIGEVVSGTQSPSLGMGMGMGYVPAELAKAGASLRIEIRGKLAPAVIVPKPIYKKPV
ncbi:MAG: glycine cleavage system aminomethyltransferase GcvT [Verrucomicrobia bacterium]|nr:glycine cleavage system aminomethyltransferase GcvT [Verrucomicrobiota bacterium]